jgi:hypothetical protein
MLDKVIDYHRGLSQHQYGMLCPVLLASIVWPRPALQVEDDDGFAVSNNANHIASHSNTGKVTSFARNTGNIVSLNPITEG